MDKPIDARISEELNKFKFCPFCGITNEIHAISELREFIVKKKVVKMNQYIYKCKSCNEGFTTTLSDEISFEGIIKK